MVQRVGISVAYRKLYTTTAVRATYDRISLEFRVKQSARHGDFQTHCHVDGFCEKATITMLATICHSALL